MKGRYRGSIYYASSKEDITKDALYTNVYLRVDMIELT
jgi:hypothetical protein